MAMTRREMLAAGAAAAGSAMAAPSLGLAAQEKVVKSGRLKQSVCRWCYDAVLGPRRIPLDDFCKAVAAMGFATDANDHHTHTKPVRPDRGGDER